MSDERAIPHSSFLVPHSSFVPWVSWLVLSLGLLLQRANVQDGLPAIGRRNLPGIGGHVSLPMGEDVKHLSVFHGEGFLGQKRRRRRHAALRDRTISLALQSMADCTVLRKHPLAALPCLCIIGLEWI